MKYFRFLILLACQIMKRHKIDKRKENMTAPEKGVPPQLVLLNSD